MVCPRVLLIVPDRLIREGLRVLFGDSFAAVFDAADITEAEAMLQSGVQADVALVDVARAPEAAAAQFACLRKAAPGIKIVALAASDAVSLVCDPSLDIQGFLLRDISAEALIHALRLAFLGEPICAVHRDFLRVPVSSPQRGTAPFETSPLSSLNLGALERRIVRCLTVGQSNKEIARELSLPEATVKAHVKALLRKLGARNRTQAAIWGIMNGFTGANLTAPEASPS